MAGRIVDAGRGDPGGVGVIQQRIDRSIRWFATQKDEIDTLVALLPRDRSNIRWAADPNRLLPTEDPRTRDPEEIYRWQRVYAELIAFNREMIESVVDQMERAAASWEEANGQRADLVLMQAHLLRLQRRKGFWQRKRIELGRAERRSQPATG